MKSKTLKKLKIKCSPEGRIGIYIPDKESLKSYIKSLGKEDIHCFFPGRIMLGADWSLDAVLNEVDKATRIGLCLEESGADNIGHVLSLIVPLKDGSERLQIYDIGEITKDDLSISKT